MAKACATEGKHALGGTPSEHQPSLHVSMGAVRMCSANMQRMPKSKEKGAAGVGTHNNPLMEQALHQLHHEGNGRVTVEHTFIYHAHSYLVAILGNPP